MSWPIPSRIIVAGASRWMVTATYRSPGGACGNQPAASGVMRCQVTSVPSAARAASPSFGASVRDPVSHGSSGVRGMTDVTVRRGSVMPSASRTISVSDGTAARAGATSAASPAVKKR